MSPYSSRALAMVAALTALSACASGSERGPTRGGAGGGPGGPSMRGFQSAMASPIALVLSAADANHDLSVSSAEASAAFNAEWTRADANRDGKISAFEYETWSALVLGGSNSEPTRMALDPDLDGSVTPAEFKTRLGEMFSAMDNNHDGSLSRTEMLVQPAPMMRGEPGGGMRSGPPAGGGRGQRGLGGPG